MYKIKFYLKSRKNFIKYFNEKMTALNLLTVVFRATSIFRP